MLEVYTAATTNGQRASIVVLESGLPHRFHWIDISGRQNKSRAYLELNPNGQVPTLVDTEGPDGNWLALSQSNVIVLYVAEKCGRFIPASGLDRVRALEWLMFMATDTHPRFASVYMMKWAEPEPMTEAAEWFEKRMLERFKRLDSHLASSAMIVGSDYTVADIVAYPTYMMALNDFKSMEQFANLRRWAEEVGKRPAVAEAMGLFPGTSPRLERGPDTDRRGVPLATGVAALTTRKE